MIADGYMDARIGLYRRLFSEGRISVGRFEWLVGRALQLEEPT